MADADGAGFGDDAAPQEPGQPSHFAADVGGDDWSDWHEEEERREERDDGHQDRQWWSRKPWSTNEYWSWRDRNRWDYTDKRTSTEAKGYLPKVPGLDGDRQKDPKNYHTYKRRVESFVAIANAVIPEEQIGARL